MHSNIVLFALAVGVCAGASGCTNKAEAQTPTAPARMLTADTDVNQLVAGMVSTPPAPNGPQVYSKVIDGPFVLTSAFYAGNVILYALPGGQDCTLTIPVQSLDGTNGRIIDNASASYSPHSGRTFIKAGEMLCALLVADFQGITGVSWSGWKPY